MEYPDNCIRGIQSPDCLLEGGTVAYLTLFDFQSTRRRGDGWVEESINWMDDEYAIDFTFSQTKEDGQPQFKVGVAILPRVELEKVKRRHGHFDYERAPVEGNRYHGNLLLQDDVRKPVKTMIRSALALASEILLRKDHEAPS